MNIDLQILNEAPTNSSNQYIEINFGLSRSAAVVNWTKPNITDNYGQDPTIVKNHFCYKNNHEIYFD